ncbi:hypothetical protein [Archangium sp.]|uniref:hypothetical protein n=1 Tax=Archangium sp. TaxID=1872627 RepID=UPI00286BD6FC|nr:hypothetical protein [Archangium sp.]
MTPELAPALGAWLALALILGGAHLYAACRFPPAAPKESTVSNDATPSPSKPFPDVDGNGVADYREGWFWRGTWRLVSKLVLTFAKPHTLAYKGVVAAEKARAEASTPGDSTRPTP